MVMDEATTAEVDHFDLTARVRLDENILRFEVTMYKLKVVDEG